MNNKQINSIPKRYTTHSDILDRALLSHSAVSQDYMRFRGRYDGNPNYLPIYASDAKVKVATNFYRDIVKTKQGYLGGNINMTLDSGDDAAAQEFLRKIQLENGAQDKDSEMVAIASSQGIGYRLLYNYKGDIRWTNLHPESVIYMIGEGDDFDPDYAIYYYKDYRGDNEYTIAELYDRENVYIYRHDVSWIVEDEIPHMFTSVPIIPFQNNKELLPDPQPAISLIDAYDTTLSNSTTLIQQLVDSLLVIQSDTLTLDEDFVAQIKEFGFVLLGPDDSMSFIDRSVNDKHIQDNLRLLRKNIYTTGSSIDYSDEDMSGNIPVVAFRQKLSRLEAVSKTTERKFLSALYHQYKMIAEFYATYRNVSFNPYDIEFTFTRTYPKNIAEEISTLALAINLMAVKDAYSLMSFVDNTEEWEERYREEQTLYPDLPQPEDEQEDDLEVGTGE